MRLALLNRPRGGQFNRFAMKTIKLSLTLLMAFSGIIHAKAELLTLGGQFEAYKRGQLERNIQSGRANLK